MKIKEIEKTKKIMGEIEFYQYFFFDSSEEFIKENIERFREEEKILRLINRRLQQDNTFDVELFEGSLSITNKKTKESYHLTIEF